MLSHVDLHVISPIIIAGVVIILVTIALKFIQQRTSSEFVADVADGFMTFWPNIAEVIAVIAIVKAVVTGITNVIH